jgi:tryptophan-rich sensory protein
MEGFRLREVPMLIGSILIPLVIGYLGAIVTLPQISTWYSTLSKPWWSPPNWLFGPIWTTLYLLMGIALFLVWREGVHRRDVKFAILIFGVQLVINLLWSVVFFSFHALFGSFVIVMFLWLAILANIIAFVIISKWAGLLLVPYIIWVSIASYLNYSVYLLNH